MSENSRGASPVGRLLWPEQRPVSESDRKVATARINRAHATGVITGTQALERQAQVPPAKTKADLRPAIDGLPGSTPQGLLVLRQGVTMLWFGVTLLQFSIWTLICLFSLHFINPWWWWTLVGGGLVVGGLWWLAESENRTSDISGEEGSSAS